MREFTQAEKFMFFMSPGGQGDPFPQPPGFVDSWFAYYVDKMELVTGDNVNEWEGYDNGTIMSQGTAIDQPVLVEQDVVKKATLVNMPTLDTVAGALKFTPISILDKDSSIIKDSNSFTIEMSFKINDIDGGTNYVRSSTNSFCYIQGNSSGSLGLRSDGAVNRSLLPSGYLVEGVDYKIVIKNSNNSAETWVNDVLETSVDTTGLTYSDLDRLGPAVDLDYYSFKVWNSADDSGEPDFELLADRPDLMRNASADQPSNGDSISAWLSTTHIIYNNTIDSNDSQYMEDYPTIIGDATHVVKSQYNTLGTVKKDISSSTTSAWFGANASDRFQAVADDGTVYEFTEYAVTLDRRTKSWVIRGNNLEFWLNGYLATTKDITGKTFTVDRKGAPSDSDNAREEFRVPYNVALSEDDIKWFSYLRDNQNEILTPPLSPEQPPIIYSVNSANLNGSSQYFTTANESALQLTGPMASCIWVKDQVDNAIFFSKYSYSDNDRSWNIRSQNNVYRVVASNDGSSTTVVEGTTASASDTWRFLVLNYTGSSLELWVDGVLENSSTFSGSLNNTSAGIGVGSYAGVNAGEALMTGSVSKPMIFSRSLTSGEISTLCGGGTPHCFSDIPASITDDCVYAPRLCNYNSNSGQELVDQSSSGITTTNIGSTPFNGTGLSVECST